ncbi:MAG: DUF1910 domain-containing protein [Lachnospiraceae bacterium]|nr:DUF1910 domain-containing protein [Lachnospiraceae bacterium]
MNRDNYKSIDYFEKYLKNQKSKIAKFNGVLSKIDENDADKIRQCKRILANFYMDLFTAEYSYGASKDELERTFSEYCNLVKESAVDSYSEMVDLLSISILLDWQENVKWIKNNETFDDSLIKSLKAYLYGDGQINDASLDLKYPDYYKVFAEYLDGIKDAEELIQYVNKEWYSSSIDMSWYDSHLSKEDIYVGYWCWLAAAVLKIKECSISNEKYIPSDF